jgi:hypothetical protein
MPVVFSSNKKIKNKKLDQRERHSPDIALKEGPTKLVWPVTATKHAETAFSVNTLIWVLYHCTVNMTMCSPNKKIFQFTCLRLHFPLA